MRRLARILRPHGVLQRPLTAYLFAVRKGIIYDTPFPSKRNQDRERVQQFTITWAASRPSCESKRVYFKGSDDPEKLVAP